MVSAGDIESVAVYPPIGVARVGNADGEDDFFFATEVIGGTAQDRAGYRDTTHRLKRQAVRFRIYARLKTGEIRELVAGDNVSIEWRVHVANLKAGWYQFNQAMDLQDGLTKPAQRRNAGRRRALLDITPAPRRISGRNVSGPEFAIDDGQFWSRFVALGELRTDTEGRLIFLGGKGKSAPFRDGLRPLTFANNDGWHDDVSDGPVRASVRVDGTTFEADPGYVVVAPPNFAPGLFGVVTMDDVVRDTFFAGGILPRPATTRFTEDVWRIFDRMTGMQWVNHGLFVAHGFGSPLDARDPGVIARLRNRDASGAAGAWRDRVFRLFRDPGAAGGAEHRKVPQVFGDAYGEPGGDGHPRRYLAVTPTMYGHLQRWLTGDVVDDWPGAVPAVPSFETLEPRDQVAHLERAGLYECLGGPFHPGIELTWVMRRPSLWKAAYRLNLLPEGTAVRQDYGTELTPEVCLGPGGPTTAAGPGALTRWMGVPWQTDEASCNSDADYAPSVYLSMPSFWGARVPDQVLSREAWERATDDLSPEMQRLKHFFYREDWLRDVRSVDYFGRIARMVDNWWKLGTVMAPPAGMAATGSNLPAQVHVEWGRHPEPAGSNEKKQLAQTIERIDQPTAAPAAAGIAGAAAGDTYVPPARTFRRGEI